MKRTLHATHNVLRSVNFYEAAAQGDFEDIPPNNGHHGDVTVLPTNPCPACAMVGEGNHQFCGVLGIHYVMDSSPCDGTNTCSQTTGYQCQKCSSIAGYDGSVGDDVYRCVESQVFDENA